MEDSSDVGGIVENYQVIPAINKLDENYYEPDFYPADGEPAYESGDATSIGEGLGEYDTGGGGSHDDFMSELGETDEAFANAFGDGIKRFGNKLRSQSRQRQAKRRRKKRRGTVARNLAAGRGGPRRGRPAGPRRGPRRGPPPRMANPNRGPVGGNAPKQGVSSDVREMDAQIRKFASEPIANADGKYGNGWGEWKTAGGGSYDNADGKGEGISTTTKVAIAVGSALVVGTIIFLVVRARRKKK